MKIALPRTLSLLVAIWLTKTATGQGFIIDQQSPNGNTSTSDKFKVIQASQPIGQSFIPVLNSIDFVRLQVYDTQFGNSIGATVRVNLWGGSIGTGTLLSSTDPVILPDSYAGTGTPASTTFLFATSISMTPGATYFFQPVVQSGDSWGIGYDTFFYYTGGAAMFNGTIDANSDLWFQEGIIVPEPASVWLLLMGGGVLLSVRHAKHWHKRPAS
jgi:hypothetical protein